MLSNSYAQYVNGIIGLVRSITMKSIHTMNTMNSFLKAGGEVLSTDPHSFKYYLNLNGVPYTSTNGSMSDREMQTFSPDTDTIVILTKELLITHTKLHNRLKRRDTLYTLLLEKYPENELLLNGIINPIDPETAIAANDYQILHYDDRYVDVGETNLIDKLQEWIYNFSGRWDVHGYRLCDPLYPAALIGILYLNMVSALINIRLENCGTEYVHDYHIWNYLGSWFELDKYRANITHKQALYLYRNIRYLVNNGGTKQILTMLNDNLVKEFGLQLNKFDIHRAVDTAMINLKANDYDALQANVIVTKQRYEDTTTELRDTQQSTTTTLITRMIDQGVYNRLNVKDDIETVNTRTSGSGVSRIPTGIMECIPEGTTAATIIHKDSIRIKTWLYLAATNKINYDYSLTLPGEDLYNFPLTPNDAAIMLLYASAKIFGLQGTDIPQPVVTGVDCIPFNSEQQLRGLVQSDVLTKYANDGTIIWDHYVDIFNTIRLAEEVSSLDEFTAFTTDMINRKIMQYIIPYVNYTALGRSQLKTLIRAFNTKHKCVFTATQTYEEYFMDIGVDLSTYSKQSLHTLVVLILQNYIGVEPEGISSTSINQSVIEILRVLSSYTVNIINNDHLDPPMPIDWCFSIPMVTGLQIYEYMVQELKNYIDCKFINGIRIDHPGVSVTDYGITNHFLTKIDAGTRFYPNVHTAYLASLAPAGTYLNAIIYGDGGNPVIKPFVNLSTDLDTGYEADQTAIIATVTTTDPVTVDETVVLELTGTAVVNNDYTVTSLSLVIVAGTNSASATITVADDLLIENIETVTISIISISSGLRYGSAISKNINIISDDTQQMPITVEIQATRTQLGEAIDPPLYISTYITMVSSAPVVGDQTATADVIQVPSGTPWNDLGYYGANILTLTDGTTISSQFELVTINDLLIEDTEYFDVSLINLSPGITLGTTTSVRISIVDNDFLPAVNLTLSKYTGSEAAADIISVIVTATSPVNGNQTVDLAITGTGITVGDYTIDITTVTILNGATTGTATLTIVDDALVEGTENAIITISNPSAGVTLGTIVEQILEITDNDSLPIPVEVNLSLSSYTASEDTQDIINVIVTAAVAVVGEQTVTLAVTGTGITIDDYVLTSTTITILDGTGAGSVDFTVVDDALVEGTETAIFTITNPSSGIVLGTTVEQLLVIGDNDAANPVNLSLSVYNGSEADLTATTITVTATAPVVGNQTVNISVTGTGITSGDYSITGTAIIIPNGNTIGTRVLTVVDDALVEGTETAVIAITSVTSGLTLGSTISQNFVIADNDSTPSGWNTYTYPNYIALKSMRISITGNVIWFVALATGDFGNGFQNGDVFIRSVDKGSTYTVTNISAVTSASTADWSINGDGTKFLYPSMVDDVLYEFDNVTFALTAVSSILSITNSTPGTKVNDYNAPIITEWPWLCDNNEIMTLMETVLYQPGVNNTATYTVALTADQGTTYVPTGDGLITPVNSNIAVSTPLRRNYSVSRDGNVFYILDYTYVYNVSRTMYIHRTADRGNTWALIPLGTIPYLNNPPTQQLSIDGILGSATNNIVLLKTSKFTKAGPNAQPVYYANPLRISSDGGTTFSDIASLGPYLWRSWAMSSNGNIIGIVCESWEVTGQILGVDKYATVCRLFVSRDTGATWTQEKIWNPLNGTNSAYYTVHITNNGDTVFLLDRDTNTNVLHVLTI